LEFHNDLVIHVQMQSSVHVLVRTVPEHNIFMRGRLAQSVRGRRNQDLALHHVLGVAGAGSANYIPCVS
jgi:hypothetical protein